MRHKWKVIMTQSLGCKQITQIQWCVKCGSYREVNKQEGYTIGKPELVVPLQKKACK